MGNERREPEGYGHGDGCFFFSSRRRHTRLQGDWSSDVCSSDLPFLQRARVLELVDRDGALGLEPHVEDDGGVGDAEDLRLDDLPLFDVGEGPLVQRSEEHTSELQSPCNLVCRLLLEKKNKIYE